MAQIQFEPCAVEDVRKSARLGKICYEDGVMATITIDRKSNIKFPFAAPRKGESEAAFIQRLPPELRNYWVNEVLAYCKGKQFCDGTPLQNMAWLSPGQIETLRSAGVSSVERLAKVGSGILEPFGLDGADLSRKARAWLDEQSGRAVATMQQQAAELDAMRAQNADMRAAMESMQAQLAAMQEQQAEAAQEQPEKRRGRPKAQAEA